MAQNSLIRAGYYLGRVSVLEGELLTKNDIERLLEVENIKEKMQILEETVFGDFIENIEDENDVERVLENYSRYFFQILSELTNRSVSRYFRLSFDLLNIKTLVLGLPYDKPSELGSIRPHFIQRAYEQKRWIELATDLDADVVPLETLSRISPEHIDDVLEEILHGSRLRLAKRSGFDLLTMLTKLEIDLSNIKAWWLKGKKHPKDLIEGGDINTHDFGTEEIYRIIKNRFSELAKKIDEKQPLLDSDLARPVVDLLDKYRYEQSNANRVIVFLKTKELEVKNVRLILLAGLNSYNREVYEDSVGYQYV
ncbi:MAG: hypothetical protein E3J54_03755 [Actinobacteria bacterium]|nr:MAG: hypothetical protein E3J54_03755 [Actinomycetota bacterium]